MTNEYHKIQTVFLRDPDTNFKTLLEGQCSEPAFNYLARNEWIWTEKVDGTNIRIMCDGDAPTFGGKLDSSQLPAQLVKRLGERFHSEDGLSLIANTFDPDATVTLYGEGYGAGIQKGGVYRPDQDFILFDVNINGYWLERTNVEDIAQKLGLDIVPIIGHGTLHEMVEIVRRGFDSVLGDCLAEGIVARPATELRGKDGSRIITKLKHKDFA
jgi:hypothetical protein